MVLKPVQVADSEIKKNTPVSKQLSGAADKVVLFIILYFWSLLSLDAFQAARECPYRHAATDDRSQRNEDWGIGYRRNEYRRPRAAREGRLNVDGPTMPGPAIPCRGCGGLCDAHPSNLVRDEWPYDYCTKRPISIAKSTVAPQAHLVRVLSGIRAKDVTPGRTKNLGEYKSSNNTIYARKDYDKEQGQAKQKQVPPSSSEMSKRGRSSDSPPGSTATKVKNSRLIGSEDVGTGFEQLQLGQWSAGEGTGEGQALGGEGEEVEGEADASGETDSNLDAGGESVDD